VIFIVLRSAEIVHFVTGNLPNAIINFVITKYHKITINLFENVALSKFSFIDI